MTGSERLAIVLPVVQAELKNAMRSLGSDSNDAEQNAVIEFIRRWRKGLPTRDKKGKPITEEQSLRIAIARSVQTGRRKILRQRTAFETTIDAMESRIPRYWLNGKRVVVMN